MENKRYLIKYKKEIPLLYGYSTLHIFLYKDTAIITTAKQGSSYLRELTKVLKGSSKHVITPQQKEGGDSFLIGTDITTPTKLDIKHLTELVSGTGNIKKIVFLYRDPLRKLQGGLWQDFMNSFGEEEDNITLLDIVLSKQFDQDSSSKELREAISYLEGRRLGWKYDGKIPLIDIEEFTKDIFIRYIKQTLKKGNLLLEGHTRPWCIDAGVWGKEFKEIGYDINYFNLDDPNYNLADTLNKVYKFSYTDNKVDRASNSNVKEWFETETFHTTLNVIFNNILDYELRGYRLLLSDIDNITKPKN